jgi:hypothetical protein
MVVALLAVLGVDLAVILAVLAVLLMRRRWVSRQPGSFKGAIRVVDGESDGLGRRWNRGFGRWVRDVLVWTKGPLLFRNEFVAVGAVTGTARDDESRVIRRVGKEPVVVSVDVDGGARIEMATAGANLSRAVGPFAAVEPPSGAAADLLP